METQTFLLFPKLRYQTFVPRAGGSELRRFPGRNSAVGDQALQGQAALLPFADDDAVTPCPPYFRFPADSAPRDIFRGIWPYGFWPL